jgi:hypothetical protein
VSYWERGRGQREETGERKEERERERERERVYGVTTFFLL